MDERLARKAADRPPSPPPRSAFRAREWAIVERCRTPRQVQQYLRSLPYNWEPQGATLRTFRGVVERGEAHCLEAALAAATILEQHGYPPLLLDLESQDQLDHVLFLYRRNGGWGTVARSRDLGLHGRKPVFHTVRQLVMSYFDPYVDGSARVVGYGVADLRTMVRIDWRLSDKDARAVERGLIRLPHAALKTSDRRHDAILRQFRAYKLKHPDRPVSFYRGKESWL